MFGKISRIALASAFALVLAGCQKEEGAAVVADTASPTGAVTAAVDSLKAGDLKALLASQVPPAHLEKMRADWKDDMAKNPPSDEDRKEFADNMAKLTASDAEAKLMEELEPQLVKYETEYAAQMPLMVGMGRQMLASSIEENKELTVEQKAQATQSVDALVKWIQTTNFGDRAKAKEAVGHICAAARELKLASIDEMRALSFDDAMDKGSVAMRGLKNVLATYGFSLDQVLATVKAEEVSREGDKAKVKVSYEMFGAPISFEAELVQIDGRWYGKQAIEELNKADTATTEEAPATDAPAEEAAG